VGGGGWDERETRGVGERWWDGGDAGCGTGDGVREETQGGGDGGAYWGRMTWLECCPFTSS
jgi:hypothetical protein